MKPLFILGTRPEAIKLAVLIKKFKNAEVCFTGQHKELADDVLKYFKIKPKYRLNLMKKNQNLFDLTANGLLKLKPAIEKSKPDIIFVQGDTTSALIGALAGFYNNIKVAHVEAGMRTYNKHSPFPEEMNRSLLSQLADFHFTPTDKEEKNLFLERKALNVCVVGNTGIDALLVTAKKITTTKTILVTGHRRESFGEPLKNICLAIRSIAIKNPDFTILFPVHPNPNVHKQVDKILRWKNIKLVNPLPYKEFVKAMASCYFIITDSGGIQEEAPYLGKPVLVTRTTTERPHETARIVGTKTEDIIDAALQLIDNPNYYKRMSAVSQPFGDGKASERIYNYLNKI